MGEVVDRSQCRPDLLPYPTFTNAPEVVPCADEYKWADCLHSREQPTVNACNGDSGGPLFEDHGTEIVVLGIVSFGFDSANPKKTPRCGHPRMVTAATQLAKVQM